MPCLQPPGHMVPVSLAFFQNREACNMMGDTIMKHFWQIYLEQNLSAEHKLQGNTLAGRTYCISVFCVTPNATHNDDVKAGETKSVRVATSRTV